ncbi:hypothetical protein WDV85_09630 [Pseudokineococcus sp. 5B2Z-1]|uniref:hypothetical protein n=1 Tax=Pseudokineococcus sp. 5B2Z-1 TaxID=3132744 RepID=UPI003097FF2E
MSHSTEPARTSARRQRGLLALVALPAVAVLVVLGWSSGWGGGGDATGLVFLLAFAVANLAPFVLVAVVVVVGGRAHPLGMPAAAVGVVGVAALTAVLLTSFVRSDSSTAPLLFLYMPFYLGLAVGVVALLTGGLHSIRQRRGHPGGAVDAGVDRTA